MNEETICFWNIGPQERRKRLRWGVMSWVIGLVTGIILILIGAHPALRLALFLPFASGGVGYFQYREKT